MAALEGAPVARATATGMAAVSAVFLSSLKTGDHVVAARAMFGSCLHVVEQILPRFGITTTLVDGGDIGAWEKAMRPETRMLFLETPSNPTLSIVDLKAVAKIAESHGARLVVDNAFATPALQRPMEFGAHVVVHSSTKYIDGQGRALGGVILCGPAIPGRAFAGLHAQHRSGYQPLQCLAAPEEPGDTGSADESALRERDSRGRFPGQPAQGHAGAISFPSRPSPAQSRPRPDGRRRRRGGVRSRRRQEGLRSSWPMRWA